MKLHSLLVACVVHCISSAVLNSTCPEQCACAQRNTVAMCQNADLPRLPDGKFSKRLKRLNLANNRIHNLTDFMFHEKMISTIEALVLSNNSLCHLEGDSLNGLAALITLDLSHNEIGDFQARVFEHVERLETLSLHDNPSLILPEEGLDLPKLTELTLNGCGLQTIPDHFFEHLTSLEFINLSDNKFTSFDSLIMRPLERLERVDLSFNLLSNLHSAIYALPSSLSLLNLRNNSWACDCHLGFAFSLYEEKFYKHTLTCSNPADLENEVIDSELIDRLTELCTATTTTSTTEAETEPPDDATSAELDVETIEIGSNSSSDLSPVYRRSGELKHVPSSDGGDNILRSGFDGHWLPNSGPPVAGDEPVAGDWLHSNQWWIIAITVLSLATILGVVVNSQVNRYRRIQESRSRDKPEECEML